MEHTMYSMSSGFSGRAGLVLRLFGVATLSLCGPLAWAADAPAAAPAPPPQEIHTYHVQGNVYALFGAGGNVVVQVGEQGVLVVDTGIRPMAEKLAVAVKQLAGDRKIRYVINTHMHPDHTGGNEVIRKLGETILSGNVAREDLRGQQGATVLANENVQLHMLEPDAQGKPVDEALWPTETLNTDLYNMYFNGEAVQLIHPHNAHTDGDIYVFFRKSDVIATGDLYVTTTYPIIDLAHGGSLNGIIAALNDMIDLAVPADKEEGGTYVVPGHGRIGDQADLFEYRDMVTIIRDRIQDLINKGKSLEQVKAARPTADYDDRYGAASGFWTTDKFVEAAYRSLSDAKKGSRPKPKASAG
jgi:glyoxylase-like metal-dependent hydrolase (beta-lactamase superfamily II)